MRGSWRVGSAQRCDGYALDPGLDSEGTRIGSCSNGRILEARATVTVTSSARLQKGIRARVMVRVRVQREASRVAERVVGVRVGESVDGVDGRWAESRRSVGAAWPVLSHPPGIDCCFAAISFKHLLLLPVPSCLCSQTRRILCLPLGSDKRFVSTLEQGKWYHHLINTS